MLLPRWTPSCLAHTHRHGFVTRGCNQLLQPAEVGVFHSQGKSCTLPPPMTALANTQSGNLKVKGHFGVNLPQEEHKKMMTVPDSGGYWCIELNGKT